MTRLIALFIALTLSVAHGQELDLSKFKLTFSDEFDGDQLDTTKWQAPVAARTASGLIGVQVHVGPPMKIEYRNFLLKALPPIANKPSAGTN